MLITKTSTLTGIVRSREINVTQAQLDQWQAGMLIQQAMPNISLSDREFIMNGITDEEWDDLLADEEEAVDDEPAF